MANAGFSLSAIHWKRTPYPIKFQTIFLKSSQLAFVKKHYFSLRIKKYIYHRGKPPPSCMMVKPRGEERRGKSLEKVTCPRPPAFTPAPPPPPPPPPRFPPRVGLVRTCLRPDLPAEQLRHCHQLSLAAGETGAPNKTVPSLASPLVFEALPVGRDAACLRGSGNSQASAFLVLHFWRVWTSAAEPPAHSRGGDEGEGGSKPANGFSGGLRGRTLVSPAPWGGSLALTFCFFFFWKYYLVSKGCE